MTHNTSPNLPQHLISLSSLNRKSLEFIFERADYYLKNGVQKEACFNVLQGRVVALLLFEPSTRTRLAFEIAAHRLGAIVLSPDLAVSSMKKDESLSDMVQNIEALGARIFVIRHPESGIPSQLAQVLSDSTSVINAGDGIHEHPTQALTDLFTLKKQWINSDWSNRCVTLVGDLKHSRVAHSLIDGLLMLQIGEIHLATPDALSYRDARDTRIKLFSNLESAIPGSDIIITFRLQKERLPTTQSSYYSEVCQQFILTTDRLKKAKPSTMVMHPGPINRGIEISSEVADSSQSLILQQVKNGVAVRMAVLDLFLKR